MSAGAFQNTLYETDAGNICGVTVQPETLALVMGASPNDPPSGSANQEASAIVSGGRRSIGVHVRKVGLKWTGSPPTGYLSNAIVYVPILTKLLFDALTKGTTGTYLGQPVEVVSLISQTQR